jgi:hypothetical protein
MIVILLIRYWLIAGLTSWSFLTVWLLLWRRVKVILEIPICIPINKCKITYNGCFKTMTNKGNLRWSWTTEKLSNHGCRLLAMNKQVYCIQYLKKISNIFEHTNMGDSKYGGFRFTLKHLWLKRCALIWCEKITVFCTVCDQQLTKQQANYQPAAFPRTWLLNKLDLDQSFGSLESLESTLW